jgi:hypothetical protein
MISGQLSFLAQQQEGKCACYAQPFQETGFGDEHWTRMLAASIPGLNGKVGEPAQGANLAE